MRLGLLYVDDFKQLRSRRISSLGLGYIAAYVQKHEPDWEVSIAITPQEILAFEPDMIGVSAYTETLPIAREFARHMRAQRDVPLVLGGPHIATNPDDLPLEFDLGVAGEGEEVLLKMLRLQAENALTPKNLGALQGATFRQDGAIRNTGRCPPIQDMDTLAHPNRRLMFDSMYRNFNQFEPVLHIHTARGCPYRCTFCSAPLVNPSWRFHSPEWVIAELEQIAREFPWVREITISDDLFTLKKRRLESLVRAIRAAGLHKRFAFFCSSRSNTLTHDMCRLLRDMNVVMVSFGLESASDRVISDLKGVGASQQDYERVLGMCQHYGIYAHGNFIIGAQEEYLCDLQATMRFVQSNQDRLQSVYFSHMTPFPGTRVWDEGARAERFDPEHLNYRVLDLEYRSGESVFLNRHYTEAEYAPIYERFKNLESWLNDRYYHEQSLISDSVQLEREQIPARVERIVQEQQWNKALVITQRETYLPRAERRDDLQFVSLSQFLAEESPSPDEVFQPDALIFWFVLDEMRSPEQLLEKVCQHYGELPVLSLNYHIGSYPVLSRLLLGDWSERVYGALQRRHQRYFTLQSLRRLFHTADYRSVQHWPQRFQIALNYQPLFQLLGADKLVDPDVFAYVSLWEPLA